LRFSVLKRQCWHCHNRGDRTLAHLLNVKEIVGSNFGSFIAEHGGCETSERQPASGGEPHTHSNPHGGADARRTSEQSSDIQRTDEITPLWVKIRTRANRKTEAFIGHWQYDRAVSDSKSEGDQFSQMR